MKSTIMYFALSCGLCLPTVGFAQTATTELVSVNSSGVQGNGWSSQASVSADGRFVAFFSRSTNLIPGGDANGTASDIFVHDRVTKATELISVSSTGVQGDRISLDTSVSGDGRFVAFSSWSTNLVPAGEANNTRNIFVRDRATGTTELVSVNSARLPANASSINPIISVDGRFVAFYSYATNLAPDGDANGYGSDIFIHDRVTGETELVSVNSSGVQGNGDSWQALISADGRYVAFHSRATNLVPGGDGNGNRYDVFVRDRVNGTTDLVSANAAGVQGHDNSFASAISADGRFVAYYSKATNFIPGGDVNGYLFDSFVHDRTTGETELISVNDSNAQGNGDSFPSSFSADGRYVIFYSNSDNLVAGDTNGGRTDSFVRDRLNGTTELISLSASGTQSNGWSRTFIGRVISNDGRFVAFSSWSSTLVPGGDANGWASDVFVRDRGNLSPVANAGPDREVACTSATGTSVTLDGSASSDPDGDPLSYAWSGSFPEGGGAVSGVGPSVTLPLGASAVTLVVNDGQADSAADSVTVTVAAQTEGFFSPLPALTREPTTPPAPSVSFKTGRTLPLKLTLACGTQVLTNADVAAPEIVNLTLVGTASPDLAIIDLDAGEANDSGPLFRFSATDGSWIYNLSTQTLSIDSVYRIVIQTPDGLRYAAHIALK